MTSATTHSSALWEVTTRDFSEWSNEDGDFCSQGTYSTLEAANEHAQRVAKEEEYDVPEDIEVVEHFDEDGCYYFCNTDQCVRYEDGGVVIEDFKRKVSGRAVETPAAIITEDSCGPMITIPHGRRLLRDAKFYFTGELMFMDRASAWAAVDVFGGHAAESFCEVDYAVIGAGHNPEKIEAMTALGIEQIDEATFHAISRNSVPWSKSLQHQITADDNSRQSTPCVPLPPTAAEWHFNADDARPAKRQRS
ncbi:Putative BRCT domain superfamily protein [Septoria linicola]|uniref:BRCT domain superfamily protein n=1 Tax=Septoria linicola TaxID=215465 RepID=A0A9Q9EI50_9PEZI|nr:putative BRCT domain superfamily protein [Septoria linicola]USW52456.1 Putative BRCT domain superfamily protein [Septoria linicola]